ncbi:MAG: putative voltage-gated ClC-type chloride channel ClcB [Methanocella sp. PtaU1.Bin125]|nr:MAG: putative voltage-gated ClC-type chloride channel ClcB [Methanocella sp. PtaU1.Bin125]
MNLAGYQTLNRGTTLFLTIIKWVVYASCVGVLVGISTTVFLKALGWGINATAGFPYFFLLMPFAFFASELMVKYLAPEARGHGTEQVIEAVHQRSGKIDHMVIPVKMAATIITIAFGGSAGKEGPCAQIGAGISSAIADIFRLSDDVRKKLVICGISAGFSAVFGTPIAGAIFGIEVIYVGGLMYELLLASFIAGIVSFHVSTSLGISYSYHYMGITPGFDALLFAKVIMAGIIFGALSIALVKSLSYTEKIVKVLPVIRIPIKGLIGGSILVLLALIFSTRYLGLGTGLIESSLQGGAIDWYAAHAKILFTCATLCFGGSGGIITPIFVIGSTAGALMDAVLGTGLPIFAGIGLVSMLSGSAKTPIAASIMAIELFGSGIGPYAAVACIISFIVSGYRSVYPSQVFSLKRFL